MAKVPPGTKRVEVYLPEALARKVEGLLRSEALGRVPYGSLNAFMVQRVNEFFNASRVPLGDFDGFDRGDWVAGPQSAITQILTILAPLNHAPEGVYEAFPALDPGASLPPTTEKQNGTS